MNKRVVFGFMALMLSIGVLTVFAQGGTEMPDDTADALEQAVDNVPGIGEVVEVSILSTGEDNETILTVTYITRELDEIGYRAEVLDVFYAVGAAIADLGLDVQQVALAPSVDADNAIENILAQRDDLTALVNEGITRTEFLATLEIIAGEHQIPQLDEGDEI